MNTKFIAIFESKEKAELLLEYLKGFGYRSSSGRHELELGNLEMSEHCDKYAITGEFVIGYGTEIDFWSKVDRKNLLKDCLFFDDCSYSYIAYYYQPNPKVKYGALEYTEPVYDLDNDIHMFEDAGIPREIADIVIDYFIK